MDWEIIGLFLLSAKVFGASLLNLLAYAAGIFSVIFSAVTVAAAVRFFRFRRPRGDAWPQGELPPVTILKPLKGEDRGLHENLASFCRLDYPRLQIIFTAACPDDPALAVARRLKEEFPALDLEIVVSARRIGFNPKINNVANAAALIKHDFILMSDSDVRVQPDFLKKSVAPFRDPRVGLVTAFYQSAAPEGLWRRLESLSVNAQFLPQALAAATFGMRFAMGAAILVRREAFDKSGGFENMAAHLADDFILGEAVQEAGYRLEFSDSVVDSTSDADTASEHVRHQVRWARTIRICNPSGYLGTVLLHGFALLTVKMALFGFSTAAASLALAALAAKAAAKTVIGRLTGNRQTSSSLPLLPLSEWIAFCAWLSGYRSGKVLWRGEVYSVEPRGRLKPADAPDPEIVSVA